MRQKRESRLTYKDIEQIVDYLVATKSTQNKFDCYDPEDIAQEIRIICLKALEHFDISRVNDDKLANFFGRCVDNGLKNLKRDNYIRYAPPCNADCNFLHGDEYMKNDLSKICHKWIKFKTNLQKKINIKHPSNIDSFTEILRTNSFEEQIEMSDFKKFLMTNIDADLRPHLTTIFEGDRRDVPTKYRHRIQRYIKKILEE